MTTNPTPTTAPAGPTLEEGRTNLKALIEGMGDVLKDRLALRWPTDDGHQVPLSELTVDQLRHLDADVHQIIVSADRQPTIGLLAEAVKRLPPDLRDTIRENLGDDYLEAKEPATVGTAVRWAADLSDKRRRRVRAGASGWDDTMCHALASKVSGGRTASTARLTDEEADRFVADANAVETGLLVLSYDQAGNATFVKAVAAAGATAPTAAVAAAAEEVDWKVEAAKRGVTQRSLLDLAREIAKTNGLPAPRGLGNIDAALAAEVLAAAPPVTRDLDTGEITAAAAPPAPVAAPAAVGPGVVVVVASGGAVTSWSVTADQAARVAALLAA